MVAFARWDLGDRAQAGVLLLRLRGQFYSALSVSFYCRDCRADICRSASTTIVSVRGDSVSRLLVVLFRIPLVLFIVLVAELAGIGLSLQILTGIGFPWWAIPVSFVVWLLMWKGTFKLIENGVSVLGLVTICFIVSAIKLHPDWSSAAHGLLPSWPDAQKAKYGFIAVSILGASVSPHLMYFYCSGAIEDKWDESYIPIIESLLAGMSSVECSQWVC